MLTKVNSTYKEQHRSLKNIFAKTGIHNKCIQSILFVEKKLKWKKKYVHYHWEFVINKDIIKRVYCIIFKQVPGEEEIVVPKILLCVRSRSTGDSGSGERPSHHPSSSLVCVWQYQDCEIPRKILRCYPFCTFNWRWNSRSKLKQWQIIYLRITFRSFIYFIDSLLLPT